MGDNFQQLLALFGVSPDEDPQKVVDGLKEVVEEKERLHEESKSHELEMTQMKKMISTMEEQHGQDVHSLRLKIQTQEHMAADYQDEIAGLQREMEERASKMDESYEARIVIYKDQIKDQQQLLENTEKQQTVMEQQIFDLEQKLEAVPVNVTAVGSDTSLFAAEEYAVMREEIETLQADKAELSEKLDELLQKHEQMSTTLSNKLQERTAELTEARAELNNYIKTLDKERELLVEAQVEMETLRMEQNQPEQKGNSLFGELEDRRVKAEQQLVSVKQQCTAARRELDAERMLRHRLKVQMTTMLQTNNSQRYTNDNIDRLNSLLGQLRFDKQQLMDNLQASERTQKEQMKKFTKVQQIDDPVARDKSQFAFLEALLKYKETEITKLNDELDIKSRTILERTEQNLEYHRKLSERETSLGLLKNALAQKDLLIEELKTEATIKLNQVKKLSERETSLGLLKNALAQKGLVIEELKTEATIRSPLAVEDPNPVKYTVEKLGQITKKSSTATSQDWKKSTAPNLKTIPVVSITEHNENKDMSTSFLNLSESTLDASSVSSVKTVIEAGRNESNDKSTKSPARSPVKSPSRSPLLKINNDNITRGNTGEKITPLNFENDRKIENSNPNVNDISEENSLGAGAKPKSKPRKQVNIAESCTVIEYASKSANSSIDENRSDVVYSQNCDTNGDKKPAPRPKGRRVIPVKLSTNVRTQDCRDCKQQ